MFLAVVLLFLFYQVNGGVVRYRCSQSADFNVTFTPAADGIEGRYTIELCMKRNPNVTSWIIDLWYYKNVTKCRNVRKPDCSHSKSKEPIENYTNCTNVCYSMDFDLIFAGCYNIHSTFEKNDGRTLRFTDTPVTIENNITLDKYKNNIPTYQYIPHKEDFTLRWHLGLPVTFYDVTLAPKKGDTDEYSDHQLNVTDNCTKVDWNEVLCELTEPIGCYRATFQHNVLWWSVLNEQTVIMFDICRSAVDTPVVSGGTSDIWWICGGILLSTGIIVTVIYIRHTLTNNQYGKTVLEAWIRQREIETTQVLNTTNPNILLLYAREGELGQRAVDALKELLEIVTGGEVLDLYSPDVTAVSASASAAWVTAKLMSANTKVVLLLSPAAAAVYDTILDTTQLHLQEPLLGRRAMYRCPHFGDQLFMLALRLISETVSAHQDYNKYYVAMYSTLNADIMQQLVPYRRYELPTAALTLAMDVLGVRGELAENDTYKPHVEHCAITTEAFVTHVTHNPDYLLDELIIM